jgi:hypothetical protein
VTYCPAESLVFEERDSDRIWELLSVYSGYKEPFCATTKHSLSKYSGLIIEHTYTVLAVASLTTVSDYSLGDSSTARKEKVVKLRNPWAGSRNEGWSGKGGIDDRSFWESAEHDQEFTFIKKSTVSGDYGVFYIAFDEFMHYFNQIHYCNFHDNTKITAQEHHNTKEAPKGSYYSVSIKERGTYTFQLSQSAISEQSREQR